MKKRSQSAVAQPNILNQNPDFPKKQHENPIKSSPIFSSPKKLFMICLMYRMVNALLIQTYFNPDEHWQALEVAHRIAFGYGHLTWEWSKGIRSYLHPMVFVILYKVLGVFHLDNPMLMAKAPRVLQSLFSAVGDLYLYNFSHQIFGERIAQWALFSQLTNWFMFYCFNRTLSNSLETVLTLISLYYWPTFGSRNNNTSSRKWALIVAAFACAIRPTSAITWLYVGLLELYETKDRWRFIFLEVTPIGIMVLALTSVLDRWLYQSWIFVPLNFLKFNFLSSGGDYYGTHKWHWYFTQGFTVMLLTFLPFTIAGIFQSKNWKLFGLVAWVLGLYSVLGHKEFRFVLPVLPIALMFSGYSLATLEKTSCDSEKKKKTSLTGMKCPSRVQIAVLFLLVTNIPMALYMSMVHQRGSEDVMKFLSKEALVDNKVKNILFLMPCHSTPYYSTLHRNITMRFLDCTHSDENKGAPDESNRFMMRPVGFVSELLKNWSVPSHIVLFESQATQVKELLELHSFREVKRFFHAHFKVDRDLQASVVVYSSTYL